MTGGYGTIQRQDSCSLRGEVILHLEEQQQQEQEQAKRRRMIVAGGVIVALLLCYTGRRFGFHPVAGGGRVTDGRQHQHTLDLEASSLQAPPAHWYNHMLVDHFGDSEKTWSQRYYQYDKYFGGPGHPIFIILGGEDELDNLLYPFVFKVMGKQFKAVTYSVEHRFYGQSWPIKHPTNEDFQRLLTPKQAVADVVQFIQYRRKELGCSSDRTHKHYCPVMTVGGSYPGFMSAMLRFQYPDVVDIGYAGSAPLTLYSHDVDSYAYYDKVTDVAEEASPGCPDAVRSTQYLLKDKIQDMSIKEAAHKLGICVKTIPSYIKTPQILLRELVMVIVTHFADANMDYYPPGPDTALVKGCQIFQNNQLDEFERVSQFFNQQNNDSDCFDLQSELPIGPHGRISASDWSGTGSGPASIIWDFQTCMFASECGFSEHSMFLPRPWTWEWLTKYCRRRFDYTPSGTAVLDQFDFDNLTGVERLLFTNGLNDGWSVASLLIPPPESKIEVMNFPNGAHHSDLTHNGPTDQDTDDIKAGHVAIRQLVKKWLDESRISAGSEGSIWGKA